MMEHLNQQLFTGERALFKGKDLQISHSVFADGESPLKESRQYRTRKHDLPLEISIVVCTEHPGKQHHFSGNCAFRHLVHKWHHDNRQHDPSAQDIQTSCRYQVGTSGNAKCPRNVMELQ